VAAVAAFNPVSRSWASETRPGFISPPPLDGQLLLDDATRVRLVAVPSQARTYTALYNSLPAFLSDQKTLTDDGRFDYVEGSVVTAAEGSRSFQLEAVKYFDPRAPPDDAALLAGLSFQPHSRSSGRSGLKVPVRRCIHAKSYFLQPSNAAPTPCPRQPTAWSPCICRRWRAPRSPLGGVRRGARVGSPGR